MRDMIKDSRRLPFCWQEKWVLRAIQRYFEDNPETPPPKFLVLAVYLALTWIASDNPIEPFQVLVKSIANRVGISEKAVKDCLFLLEKLGVLWNSPTLYPESLLSITEEKTKEEQKNE